MRLPTRLPALKTQNEKDIEKCLKSTRKVTPTGIHGAGRTQVKMCEQKMFDPWTKKCDKKSHNNFVNQVIAISLCELPERRFLL